MKKLNDFPTVQWVQPKETIPIDPLLILDEKFDDNVKPLVMFNEIYPSKNDLRDLEYGRYKDTEDTFHRAISPILTIGQCFGVMPVTGIQKEKPSDLKFSWRTWRVAYSIFSMTCSTTVGMFALTHVFSLDANIFIISNFIFYVSTCMMCMLFFKLARKWPAISMEIAQRERSNFLRFHKKRRTLRTKFKLCMIAVLLPALVEHFLSIISGAAFALDCSRTPSVIETYFKNAYAQVFYFTPYSIWAGFLLQIINFDTTFYWNFMDLFIIVVSIGLSERFEQLNERLETVKGKHLPDQFWKMAREEFAHLSQLVKNVDGHINEIVLLSFANNLYFICLQLFNILNNAKDDTPSGCLHTQYRSLRLVSHSIYFIFSFGFLMLRSLAVSLNAARINSSSQRPAATLYAVPSNSYGSEIQRFLDQVVTDIVALSGLNFFNVTRGLVLTIAGTIVTYELVVVQFNIPPAPVKANITINSACTTPVTT